MKQTLEINIMWLYPDLMSTYGDRGNVMILKNRLLWRGIKANIVEISLGTTDREFQKADIIFIGGAQDYAQEIINRDLLKRKKILRDLIESGTPGLFICGGYQFLGKHYVTAEQTIIRGLGIFDLFTTNSTHNSSRLIGKVSARILIPELKGEILTGFENHGGRTFLSSNIKPLAKIISGFGNNGKDSTEGAVYKNAIGAYLHGPILANNPLLADYIIGKALEKKYGRKIKLKPLDDTLEKISTDNFLKNVSLK